MAAMSDLVAQLKAEQRRLSESVIVEDVPPFESTIVAGVDVSYAESVAVGCLVVMDLKNGETIQVEQRIVECTAPYIPGYLFLREGPVLINLLRGLGIPGPLLVDGNGILHPRRLGLASQLGILLDLQTIGVAKNLLMGEIQQRKENVASILDNDDCVGTALWLSGRKKPVFVSVGHRISLSTAVEIVQHSSTSGYPEPLRRAHTISKETLQELQSR